MLNGRLIKESSYKRFYLPLAILAPFLNSILIVVSAYSLSAIANGVFFQRQPLNNLSIYLMTFFLNAILKSMFNFFIEVYTKNSAVEIRENIKEKSFKAIISGNPYKVKKEKLGEIINSLTDGIEMITPYYSQYIPQVTSAVIIPLIIGITAAFADGWSSLIMLTTYPLIPLFMILIGYKSKEASEKQWKKLNVLSSHFIDMLQGLSTLKVFGRSNIQEHKVFDTSENYRKATMEVLKISFSSALVLELFSTISTALIAVNLGLRLVYGKIAFFNAFFILILTPDFYLAIRNLGLRFHASLNGKVAIEKIDSITAELDWKNEAIDLSSISEPIFEIEVKNLSFTYENKITLNNINFKINKGEKIALVGESGGGKSTLINILSGFIKVKDGMVFINGIDINHIHKENISNKIALVSQFPHIFNKTLEDNISLGVKDLNSNELLKIYKLTEINTIKDKLKDGYKTSIGEGEKVSISGGEIQKIAIARALIKNSELIILDEPSSALDPKSEELFTELMGSYLKNTTVLIATHRLNTIKSLHKILVLHEGNLVEVGTHEKLMESKYKYYEFVKSLEAKQL